MSPVIADPYKPKGLMGALSGRIRSMRSRKEYALVAERLDLKRNDVLLDLCCGTGMFTRLHAQGIQQVFALDHSAQMIKAAIRNNASIIRDEGAQFFRFKAEDIPWSNDSFSAIASIEAMMYWKHPERVLKQCTRVLKPGGRMLATIGWNAEPGNRHPNPNRANITHLRLYTRSEVSNLFYSAGFRNVQTEHFSTGSVADGLVVTAAY